MIVRTEAEDTREALRMVGRDMGPPRPPLPQADWPALQAVLDAIG